MRRGTFDPKGAEASAQKALRLELENDESLQRVEEATTREEQQAILYGGPPDIVRLPGESGDPFYIQDPIIDPELTPPTATLFPSDLRERTDETPLDPEEYRATKEFPGYPAGAPAPEPKGDASERDDAPSAPAAPPAGKGAEEGEEKREDTSTSANDLGTTPPSTLDYEHPVTGFPPEPVPRGLIPGSQGATRPIAPPPATPPAPPTALAAQEEAFNKRLEDSLKSTKGAAAFDQTPEFQERYNIIRESQGPEMAEEFGRRTRRGLVDRFEKAYGRPASMRLIERMREGIGASIKEVEDQYLQESIESGGRLAPTPLGRAEQALETARIASFVVRGQEPPPKWTTAVGKEMVEGIDKIPTDAQTALADLYGAPGRAEEAASIVDMEYGTTPGAILSDLELPTRSLPDQLSARLELALAGENISKNLEVPLLPLSQTPRDPSATLGRDPGEARSLEDPLGETPLMTQAIGDSPLLEGLGGSPEEGVTEEQQARIAPEARQREARTTEDLTGLPSLPPANIGDSPVPEVRTELEERKVSYQSLPTDEKVERLATLSKPANDTERSALRSVALNADRAVPPEVKADMSTEPLETLEFNPGDGVEFSKEEKDGGKKKRARTPEEREERRKIKLIKNIEHSFAEKAASFLGEVEGTKGKPNKKLGPVFNRLASQGVTGPQSDCPWCAAFVTHAVKEAGGKIPTIIAARDFLKVGGKVSEGSEQEGDIGVMWNDNPDTGGRNGYGGHAIVILSQDENSITGIGGNQDDAVSVMTFPRERFLGVRRIQK